MPIIIGTSNDNNLSGTPGDDQIYGFGGTDFLVGAGGADYIDGGDGDDYIRGDDGADVLRGGTGADVFAFDGGSQSNTSGWNQGSFDLILMDMQMPVMDGLSAVRAIRAREAHGGRTRTPIVMLTENASAEHVRAGASAGGDGHLTKPITPEALFSAIETALAERALIGERSAA